MKIATEAAARWGLRYADMLEDYKKNIKEEKRIKELDRMIGTCRQVPANPARNLNKALQCFILITFIVNYIDQPQVGNGIREKDAITAFNEVQSRMTESDAAVIVQEMITGKRELVASLIQDQQSGCCPRDGGGGP